MDIVPRKDWAKQTWKPLIPLQLPVDELYVHHSGGGAPTLATMLGNERHHVVGNGWGRLGYNWQITWENNRARAYEGCGAHIGAQVAGRNSRSIGICLVGGWSTGTVPAEVIALLVDLVRHIHGLGVLSQPQITGGHGDAPGAATLCPGTAGRRAIAEARVLLAAPPVVVPPPPPTLLEEIVMDPALYAKFVADVAKAGADELLARQLTSVYGAGNQPGPVRIAQLLTRAADHSVTATRAIAALPDGAVPADLDVEAIAAAVLAEFGPEVARQVVDELARRIT